MLSLALIVILQDLPPPMPNSVPPVPVGDVPIDGGIGFLVMAAIVILFWVLRKRRLLDNS